MTAIHNIIRAAIRKPGDKFHILTCGFDGYYENMLAKTGNMVYVLPIQSRFEWKIDLPHKEKTCIILPDANDMPIDLEVDVVLCQERRVQYGLTWQVSHLLHVPLVCVEHFLGLPEPPKQRFDGHVSVSNLIAEAASNESIVIPYGMDSASLSLQKKDEYVGAVGTFNPDETAILNVVKQALPDIRVIGHNPGISTEAANQFEYNSFIKRAKVYLNLSMDGRITNHLLRAMSAGCVIISNDSPGLRAVLNKDNSILCTSAPAIISAINKVKKNSELVDTLSVKAKETVADMNMAKFTTNWNNFLEDVTTRAIYTRQT